MIGSGADSRSALVLPSGQRDQRPVREDPDGPRDSNRGLVNAHGAADGGPESGSTYLPAQAESVTTLRSIIRDLAASFDLRALTDLSTRLDGSPPHLLRKDTAPPGDAR